MKPEHLELQSADGCQLNLDALYQIAPSCFTEAKGPDGKTRRVVNFDVLRQLLGDAAADSVNNWGEEFYQFTWPGKAEARREAARPIKKTLRPVIEDSVDWDTTQNLYIEGDNLEVLKLLQKSYLGKVKMIYIDPPYNTGNDFVYDDDFAQSASDYAEASGDVDEFGNRYRRNTDSNGRFHSDWCSMMYPRLQLARTLLSDDGVIFISIDDNEVENLIKLCNDIFGEDNSLGIITWSKKRKGSFLSKGIISLTEYCIAYAKDRNSSNGLYGGEPDSSESQPIIKRTNKVSVLSIPANIIETKLRDGIYQKGVYGDEVNPVELLSDVEVRNGKIITAFNIKAPFIWSQAMFDDQLNKGAKFVINTLNFQIRVFRIYDDTNFKGFPSYINGVEISGTNEDAYEEISKIFNIKKLFDYSKPRNFIKKFIEASSHFDNSAIILDFFSGSATTAHAVMQLNAEDGGKRRFIMVQLPEVTEENSEARKAGYANICEIGKERIRRAGKKVKEEAGLNGQDLDIGFRVFRVDESNMEDVYFQPNAYSQDRLDMLLDNIKADRTDLDLLFGAMLDWGLQLSLPMVTKKVKIEKLKVEIPVYVVNEGDLVACFSENISEEVIEYIAEQSPLRVLLRDSCFSSDADKINIFEQFKQRLGWSDEEAYKNIRVI